MSLRFLAMAHVPQSVMTADAAAEDPYPMPGTVAAALFQAHDADPIGSIPEVPAQGRVLEPSGDTRRAPRGLRLVAARPTRSAPVGPADPRGCWSQSAPGTTEIPRI